MYIQCFIDIQEMNKFYNEEKRICEQFGIEPNAITENCINRYRNTKLNNVITYINNRRACPEISCAKCGSIWISDISLHHCMSMRYDTNIGTCAQCAKNQRIFLAQAEFAAKYANVIVTSPGYQYPQYTVLRRASSLFGGSAQAHFDAMTFVNDNPSDFIEERMDHTGRDTVQ